MDTTFFFPFDDETDVNDSLAMAGKPVNTVFMYEFVCYFRADTQDQFGNCMQHANLHAAPKCSL